jgi:predicted lipoprotein with Yx(FWY)xxD motif
MRPSILGGAAALLLAAAALAAPTFPSGVKSKDGALTDAQGRPLYTFDLDTMVGMSHCFGDCTQVWPPLAAPKGAKAVGEFKPIRREDGSLQWTYRDKPLYTYSKDQPGGPPTGLGTGPWTLARGTERR